MFGLGAGEVILVLVIALVLLGPKRLPELATNIGKGMREFNRARQGLFDSIERPITEVQREVAQTTTASASPTAQTEIKVALQPSVNDSSDLVDEKQGKA